MLGSSNATAAAKPASPIESAMEALLDRLDDLNSLAGVIDRTFGKVLLPEPPDQAEAPTSEGPQPVAIESDLLASINVARRRALLLDKRLHGIVARAQI